MKDMAPVLLATYILSCVGSAPSLNGSKPARAIVLTTVFVSVSMTKTVLSAILPIYSLLCIGSQTIGLPIRLLPTPRILSITVLVLVSMIDTALILLANSITVTYSLLCRESKAISLGLSPTACMIAITVLVLVSITDTVLPAPTTYIL